MRPERNQSGPGLLRLRRGSCGVRTTPGVTAAHSRGSECGGPLRVEPARASGCWSCCGRAGKNSAAQHCSAAPHAVPIHGSGVQPGATSRRIDKLALDCSHGPVRAVYGWLPAGPLSTHGPAASRVSVRVRGSWQKTSPIPRRQARLSSAPSRGRITRFHPHRHASGRSAASPRWGRA